MKWFSRLFNKLNPFKGKPVYVNYPMGNNSVTPDQEKLIAKNKNLLLDNQVAIGKVRFVFQPMFTYDVEKNIINPKYDLMLPIDINGNFIRKAPVIEVGKPPKMILVCVDNYSIDDNYAFIKTMLNGSKRGVVILLADEEFSEFDGSAMIPYQFGVDTEVLRIINLDEVVERYKCQDIL